MSQDTALRVLEKAKRPLTTDEISKLTGVGRSSTGNNLRKMVKQGIIGVRLQFNEDRFPTFVYYINPLFYQKSMSRSRQRQR